MKGARERFGCIHTHNSNNKKRERKRHDMEVSRNWHGTPMKWWTSCSQLVVPPFTVLQPQRTPQTSHHHWWQHKSAHSTNTFASTKRTGLSACRDGNLLRKPTEGVLLRSNTIYTYIYVIHIILYDGIWLRTSSLYRISIAYTHQLRACCCQGSYQCVWHYGSKSWRLRDPREQLSPLALWYSNLKRNAWKSFYSMF